MFLLPGVNGGYTPWSKPGKCTRSCGGGVKLETRTCSNPKPSLNGADCKGASAQLPVGASWCNTQVRMVETVSTKQEARRELRDLEREIKEDRGNNIRVLNLIYCHIILELPWRTKLPG